jgi:hypothetical protein
MWRLLAGARLGLVAVFAGAMLGAQSPPSKELLTIRRADAKAYHPALKDSRRLPRVGTGEPMQTLTMPRQVARGPAGGPDTAETEGEQQIVEATCDADLVVVGRLDAATPFLHPNGRWILTAHDVEVSTLVRARDRKTALPQRLIYVHPSGALSIGGRTYATVLDGFAPLSSDEEQLLFLVRIGRGGHYRSLLTIPVLAIRGGLLYAQVVNSTSNRSAFDGSSAREVIRLVHAAVCRPATPPRGRWAPTGGHTLPWSPP